MGNISQKKRVFFGSFPNEQLIILGAENGQKAESLGHKSIDYPGLKAILFTRVVVDERLPLHQGFYGPLYWAFLMMTKLWCFAYSLKTKVGC